jgi:hypothetical protein
MNPEQSRRVDAALDQLRSLQRPYPHQPVMLDTLGSTARVAHLEETAATTEIPRPTRNSTKLGKIRYDTCCGRSRFTNSSKRTGTRQRQAAAKRSS